MAVKTAIGGGSFDQCCAAVSTVEASDQAIAAILAGDWRGKAREDIDSSGYVAHSLEASFWCIGRGDDFRDMVLLAANLGRDADTTAAITGQLAGALFGASGIPDDWLGKLAWRERLEVLADGLLDSGGF